MIFIFAKEISINVVLWAQQPAPPPLKDKQQIVMNGALLDADWMHK